MALGSSSTWRGPFRGDFRQIQPIRRVGKPTATFVSPPAILCVTHRAVGIARRNLTHGRTPKATGIIKAPTKPVSTKLSPKSRSQPGSAESEPVEEPSIISTQMFAPPKIVVQAQQIRKAKPTGTMPKRTPRTFTRAEPQATSGETPHSIPETPITSNPPRLTVESFPDLEVTEPGRTLVGRKRARNRVPASDIATSVTAPIHQDAPHQQDKQRPGRAFPTPEHRDEDQENNASFVQKFATQPDKSPAIATEPSVVNPSPDLLPSKASWRPRILEANIHHDAGNGSSQPHTTPDESQNDPLPPTPASTSSGIMTGPISHSSLNPVVGADSESNTPQIADLAAPGEVGSWQASGISATLPRIIESAHGVASEANEAFTGSSLIVSEEPVSETKRASPEENSTAKPAQEDTYPGQVVAKPPRRDPGSITKSFAGKDSNQSTQDSPPLPSAGVPFTPSTPSTPSTTPSRLSVASAATASFPLVGEVGLVQRRASEADIPSTLSSPTELLFRPDPAASPVEDPENLSAESVDRAPRLIHRTRPVSLDNSALAPIGTPSKIVTVPADVRFAVASVMGSSPHVALVHRGDRVQQISDTLNAEAFTQNGDVHIPGDLPLTSSRMKRLLAHEITHVVQQRGHINTRSEHSPLGRRLESQALDVEEAHSMAETIHGTLPSIPPAALAAAREGAETPRNSSPLGAIIATDQVRQPINSLSRVRARSTPPAPKSISSTDVVQPLSWNTASAQTTSLSRSSRSSTTIGPRQLAATHPPVNNSASNIPVANSSPSAAAESGAIQRRSKKITATTPNQAVIFSAPGYDQENYEVKKATPGPHSVRETKPIDTSVDHGWLEKHAEALYPLIRKHLRNDLLKDRERRGKLMRDN